MEKEARTCLECNKSVVGRIDKKFCNDWCRNNYNNKLKVAVSAVVRNINSILRKNRKILEEVVPGVSGSAKASKQKLLQKGFDFNYYTNINKTKKGTEYFFCYEYGYLMAGNESCYIIKRKTAN